MVGANPKGKKGWDIITNETKKNIDDGGSNHPRSYVSRNDNAGKIRPRTISFTCLGHNSKVFEQVTICVEKMTKTRGKDDVIDTRNGDAFML